MGVIAKNKEDYISFSIKVPIEKYVDKNGEEKDKLIKLRFIDSFKFMPSSLDSLSKNLMFEWGIIGGITQAVRKCASANNKYMGDRFDPKSESSYLQYLDANNLYGWAMSQPLPTGGFRWVDVNPNEISELGI